MPQTQIDARGWIFEIENATVGTFTRIRGIQSWSEDPSEGLETVDMTTFDDNGVSRSQPMQRGNKIELTMMQLRETNSGPIGTLSQEAGAFQGRDLDFATAPPNFALPAVVVIGSGATSEIAVADRRNTATHLGLTQPLTRVYPIGTAVAFASGSLDSGQARLTEVSALVSDAARVGFRYRHTTQRTWTLWPCWAQVGETGGEHNAKTATKYTITRDGVPTFPAVT